MARRARGGIRVHVSLQPALERTRTPLHSAALRLWTEQKLWIRSLTDRQFLRYPNPYLFNEDGSPTVDISTAKEFFVRV
ncbi:hypothetical protein EMIHUDRAFT_247604 [Emiliania huxleyi CCMP1516]|uniref:Uncharacterized protein n=2 Tax=Emiliania huxleyi TaxID=2903 RepID=A0A0D3IL99_EMIH1|nr:hypothetical protein EMIHUDRAFT_247604 [Emiliania huxleyi CCMP1516]EOD12034.1 hypothetical protein EMIHUDRAFT_247604 [Emiliania huxleyi CCMP1516]|eukprot:XP_005764463.1 hypothetical protein EMIHUDRAFT_247604 [Emiliania huxleyi CCMP1516]